MAQTVTVTGLFLREDGVTPARGRVLFELSTELRDTVSQIVYATTPRAATLDANGRISIGLVSTDDANLTPVGATYKITEIIDGVRNEFDAVLPANSVGGIADISTLSPSSSAKVYGVSQAQLSAAIAGVTNVAKPAAQVQHGALLSGWTFARSSTRTHPRTGAEVAANTPVIRTVVEVVAKGVREVPNSNTLFWIGEMPDGRFVFKGASGTYTSPDGLPPYTQISTRSASRVTPSGALLDFSPYPSVVTRTPGPNYKTSTAVMTMDVGEPALSGGSGRSTSWIGSGMNYAHDGKTIWMSEYGPPAIKDTINPPRSLWRSDDDGVTWTRVYQWAAISGSHCHALYYDTPTGYLYASNGDGNQANAGIWKSTDRGATFTKLTPPTGWDHTQPTCFMRYGDYIVCGGDETPAGVWVVDPVTDVVERWNFDYDDTGSPVTQTGVVYNLAVLSGLLVATAAQGNENYSSLFASEDGRHWHRFSAMDTSEGGWSQIVRLKDGSFLCKPGQLYTPNYWHFDGLELVYRDVVHTDAAVKGAVPSTTPLVTGAWTLQGGAVLIAGGGPQGLDSAKLGTLTNSALPVLPNTVYEFNIWARNPFALSGSLLVEWFWRDGSGTTINQQQRGITNNELDAGEWRRFVIEWTAPSNAASAFFSVRSSGFVFDANTAYYEVAGVTVNEATRFAGMETHTRTAESLSYSLKVQGAAWGVYDRCYPNWPTNILDVDRTLLTVTNTDSGAALSVVYVTATKQFKLTQSGQSDTLGPVVRCMGPGGVRYPYRHNPDLVAQVLRNYGTTDFLAYGIRCNGATAELVVWDKPNRVAATYAAPAAFGATSVQITFPGSNVAHAPVLVERHLTGDELYDALVRGVGDAA